MGNERESVHMRAVEIAEAATAEERGHVTAYGWANDTAALYVEYREQHGYDHERAAALALGELRDGLRETGRQARAVRR